MEFTQYGLLMLLLVWSLQVIGAWVQWRHYRQAMDEASGQWSDGFLGLGKAKAGLGGGAIALLEVAPELRVRRLRTMGGLSVFARMKAEASVRGWTLDELAAHYAPRARDTPVARAVRQAIEQIEEVRRRPT